MAKSRGYSLWIETGALTRLDSHYKRIVGSRQQVFLFWDRLFLTPRIHC